MALTVLGIKTLAKDFNALPTKAIEEMLKSGTKKPSGAAAKLLQVIEKHGLAVLA